MLGFFFPFSSSSPAGKCVVSNNTPAMWWEAMRHFHPKLQIRKLFHGNFLTWLTWGRFDFYSRIKTWTLGIRKRALPKINGYWVTYLTDKGLATLHAYYLIDHYIHQAGKEYTVTTYREWGKRLWEVPSLTWDGKNSSWRTRSWTHIHLLCYSTINLGIKTHIYCYVRFSIRDLKYFLLNAVFIYNGILFSHKENEILSFSGKWMELENIILSEVNQVQKAKGHMFSLICGI
jgi:hypothetical protein